MIVAPEPGDHLRIVAIVDARGAAPHLWDIVASLGKAQFVERVALATTNLPQDDAVAAAARERDIAVVRGAQDDMLACFARAADILDADIVVRVAANAPPVQADFVDHLVASLIEQNGDYVVAEDDMQAVRGIEPFSRRALDKLMMDARDDAVARRAVCGYFRLHPGFVRMVRAPIDPAAAWRLPNAAQTQCALIRCDAGHEDGGGRVRRMLALARALRDREGIGSVFAVNGPKDMLASVTRAGFDAEPIQSHKDAKMLDALAAAHKSDLLVCDMQDGMSGADLAGLSCRIALTAVIDDASDRRLAADLAYYPLAARTDALAWTASRCEHHAGWQWTIVGAGKPQESRRPAASRPTVIVAPGENDSAVSTLRVAHALAGLDPTYRVRFILGAHLDDRARIARTVVGLASHFETLEGADDLVSECASADLALTAFGVNAYDLAAHGIPALYLCGTEDQAASAAIFENAGMGRSLGRAETISDETIANAVQALLADTAARRAMRAAGRAVIDGAGAERVAAHLAAKLSERCEATPSRLPQRALRA